MRTPLTAHTSTTASPIVRASTEPVSSSRRPRPARWNMHETIAGYIFILPAVIGFSVFVAYPMAMAAYLAFTKWNGYTDPSFIGLKNFQYLFEKDPAFIPTMKATFLFAFWTVPMMLLLGLLLALLINRNMPGVRLFRTIIYLPVVLPMVASLTLWKFIYDPQVGLANQILNFLHLPTSLWLGDERTSMASLIIVTLWGVGGTMLIFLAGLQSVPVELYEAARIDGANPIRIFLNMTLPLISPILFLQLILQLNAAMQTFNQPKLLTNGGPGFSTNLIMLSIYKNGFGNLGTLPDLGYATAQVWVLFFIVLLLTFFTFRFSSFWVYSENEID